MPTSFRFRTCLHTDGERHAFHSNPMSTTVAIFESLMGTAIGAYHHVTLLYPIRNTAPNSSCHQWQAQIVQHRGVVVDGGVALMERRAPSLSENEPAFFVSESLPYAARSGIFGDGSNGFPHRPALLHSLLRSFTPSFLRKDPSKMPLIRNRPASEAAAELTSSDFASLIQDLSTSALSKTARRFSRSTAVPFRGTSRSQKYRKEPVVNDCPKGQNYYACQSTGFKGCCSKNACDPNVNCSEEGEVEPRAPIGNTTTTQSEPITSGANTQSVQSLSESAHDATTTTSETRPVKSIVTSAAGTPSEATGQHTAIRATEDVASAPSCPRGNGTTFTDNTNIAYIVRCNSDNTASAFSNMQVSIGGYAQCFSSCSNSSDCAGFTYNGEDSGVCYLKSKMPRDGYVAKSGNNYISCAKIDPSASAPRPTASAQPDTSAKQPNKGAIAGGVVGGIAIICFVLFLIAFLARRRRKEMESKRATLTHVFGGAVEPGRRDDDHDAQNLPLHNRAGSTSHDVFAPYGGAYYPQYSSIAPAQSLPQMQQSVPPRQQHARQRSIYRPHGEGNWL